MARFPWDVGMHVPLGLSDSGASNQVPIPQELIEDVPAEPPVAKNRCRSSSTSYEHSAAQSPSPSFMVDASDIPPSTPAKEEPTPAKEELTFNSRWSVESLTSPQDSSVSEIRFANPSDAEVASSSSGSSTSSSGVSSMGSEYSATRTPGVSHIAPEPHVSDADLTLAEEAEGYAYAYAASLDTPVKMDEQESESPLFGCLLSDELYAFSTEPVSWT